MELSKVFLIISLVLFLLEALGAGVIPNQIAWGLAAFVAAHI